MVSVSLLDQLLRCIVPLAGHVLIRPLIRLLLGPLSMFFQQILTAQKWGFGQTIILLHHFHFYRNGVTWDPRPRLMSLYSKIDVNTDREYLVKT